MISQSTQHNSFSVKRLVFGASLLAALVSVAGCTGDRVSSASPIMGDYSDVVYWTTGKIYPEHGGVYNDENLAALITDQQSYLNVNFPNIDKYTDTCNTIVGKSSDLENSIAIFNCRHSRYSVYPTLKGLSDQDKATVVSALDVTKSYVRDRNTIQDALLQTSVSSCTRYEAMLRQEWSDSTFLSSAVSAVSGTVGALVTGTQATRIFSGLAGASSGVGAAYSQSYFNNIATNVIVPGIDQRRHGILTDILHKRCYSLETYTLTLAIADALRFHAACNVDSGIAEASKAVKNASNPSLDVVADTLTKLQAVNQKLTKAAVTAKSPAGDPAQTQTPAPSNTADQSGIGDNVFTTIDGIDLPTTCDPRLLDYVADKSKELTVTPPKNSIIIDGAPQAASISGGTPSYLSPIVTEKNGSTQVSGITQVLKDETISLTASSAEGAVAGTYKLSVTDSAKPYPAAAFAMITVAVKPAALAVAPSKISVTIDGEPQTAIISGGTATYSLGKVTTTAATPAPAAGITAAIDKNDATKITITAKSADSAKAGSYTLTVTDSATPNPATISIAVTVAAKPTS